MGGMRVDIERLKRLLPDPTGAEDGEVVTKTSYVDERGLTQDTYTLETPSAPPSGAGGPYITGIAAAATQSSPYTFTPVLHNDGGATNVLWEVLEGTTPASSIPFPGVTMNTSTGAVSGTPTTPGSYDFELCATPQDGTNEGATSFTRQSVTVASSMSFATWDPSVLGPSIALSLGNTRATGTSGGAVNSQVFSDNPFTVDTYFEMVMSAVSAAEDMASGVAAAGSGVNTWCGDGNTAGFWTTSGRVYAVGVLRNTLAGGPFTGIVRVRVAIKPSTREVWFGIVGVSGWSGGGDPALGTSPSFTVGGGSSPLHASCTPAFSPNSVDLISDPSLMTGTAPAGFTAGF